MVANYFLENWALILILLAFTALLKTTVFLEPKTIKRMYILIVLVFLLSIVVYVEFLLADLAGNRNLRLVLSVIQRFSARGENIDDLFQVGCIGLIKAIDNFDADAHDVRFSTYCVPAINGWRKATGG